MKISKIHISAFGCYQNRDFEFADGLQEVILPNGTGKSTLCSFIKVMFYGFENDSARTKMSREREIRRPWGGGVYGGTIVFSANGREYRLEKVFGSKPAEDEFFLYDALTGALSDDYRDPIGPTVFGLSADAFLHTLFITDREMAAELNSDIKAYLADETDDRMALGNYEAAIDKLTQLSNATATNRRNARGGYAVYGEQIEECREKLSNNRRLPEDKNRIAEEIESLQAKIAATRAEEEKLEKSIQEITERKILSSKLSEYRRLKQNALKRREKKEESEEKLLCFDHSFDLSKVDESIFSEGYRISEELPRCRQKAEELQRKIEEEKAKQANLDERIKTRNGPAYGWGIVMLLGFLCIPACLFLSVSSPVRYGLLTAGVILVALGIVGTVLFWRKKNRIADGQNTIDEAIDSYRTGLQENRLAEEKLRAELRDVFRRLNRAYDENHTAASLRMIENDFQAFRNDCAEYEKSRAELKTFEEENVILQTLPADYREERDVEEVQKQLSLLRRTREQQQDELRSKEGEKQNILERLAGNVELEERVAELTEKRNCIRKKNELYSAAKDLLNEAKNSMSARYKVPVEEKLADYLADFFPGGEEFRINEDGKTVFDDNGFLRSVDLLSAGYRDITYFALRLAMTASLFSEGTVLFLDDPFVHLDRENTERAKQLVRRIAEDYQIIYFSCREDRRIGEAN